jgi:hypothetical protein
VDAKTSLALWLRAGRCQKGLSLDEVARKTKIQARILEQLESGKLEGLPADVFVRGFIRSMAKCVGLDEDEALRRYGAIGLPAAPVAARALIETMSDLAPAAARTMPRVLRTAPEVFDFAAGSTSELPAAAPPIEPAETFMLPSSGTLEPVAGASAEPVIEVVAEVAEAPDGSKPAKKKAARPRGPGAKKSRGGKRKAMATGTPFEPTPIVPDMVVALPPAGIVEAISVEQPVVAPIIETAPGVDEAPMLAVEASTAASTIDWSQPLEPAPSLESSLAIAVEQVDVDSATSSTWAPKMPSMVASSTPPWRRPSLTTTLPVVPSLVIDDSDPDSAERELEDRAASKDAAPRRSFLPPILRDLQDLRDDRSDRQGGLTLAVIILLIAATLTLSYLMRRPSSSGDGVTRTESASQLSVG